MTGAEPWKATTYSLSVWLSEVDLREFLSSPIHVPLVHKYKRKLDTVRSVTWQMEEFSPDEAWREGQRRLAEASRPEARPAAA